VISATQRTLPDKTQNHNRQTSMPPVGFDPAIPARERPQYRALDRAANGNSDRIINAMRYEEGRCPVLIKDIILEFV